jgi:hypothetical protein
MPEIDYLEESGPGITELPQLPAGGPPPPGGEPEVAAYPGWQKEQIEQFLRGTGAGIHWMIGAGEADWLFVQEDLDRIGPPLTRIMNTWEPAVRLSPLADPLLLIHGLALYCWRSALEMTRAKRDAAEELLEGEPRAHYEQGPAPAAAEPEGQEQDEPEVAPSSRPAYFPESTARSTDV